MGDALGTLESIYFSFQANLEDMLAACKTQADRDAIMSQYVAARQNYWQCIDRTFHNDDPAVQSLVAEAKVDIAQLNTIDNSLGDIAKVINIATEVVTVGSKIAAKVITL
jgi:hypothetical protein